MYIVLFLSGKKCIDEKKNNIVRFQVQKYGKKNHQKYFQWIPSKMIRPFIIFCHGHAGMLLVHKNFCKNLPAFTLSSRVPSQVNKIPR